jgi:hypothetical protein
MKTRRATRRPKTRKQTAQDKAAMMALRAKGINPGRSEAAKRAWKTRYAKLPDVSRSDVRRIEAMRGERAMSADARRTGAVVLEPGDKRVFYWTRRPGGYDVAGIDTEGARQPKPIDADRNAPFLKFKRASEQRRRLREQGRPARPAHEAPAPAKTKDEQDERKSQREAGRQARDAAEALVEPGNKPLPAFSGSEQRYVDSNLKHILFGELHRAQKAAKAGKKEALAGLNYNLDDGGFLASPDGRMAIFNPKAKTLTPEQVKALAVKTGAFLGHRLNSEPVLRFTGDLGAYLKTVDPSGKARFVPVRDSLYRGDDLHRIARAFGGRVEMRGGYNSPLMVLRDTRGIMVMPHHDEQRAEAWEAYLRDGGKPAFSAKPAPPRPASEAPAAKPTPKAPAPEKAPAKPKAASAAKPPSPVGKPPKKP